MNRLLLIPLLATLGSSIANAETTNKERALQSKLVVKEFMGQLKGELQTAMKTGGPVNAINVCKEQAPVIAQNLSDKHGWKVARTSLKVRNPANAPDAWETSILKSFENRKLKGEKVKPMAHFETVKTAEGESFRFMKAIPTGKVCLACHGENINDSVAAKLKTSYPNDKATGFKAGDIRGAFSITQPIK